MALQTVKLALVLVFLTSRLIAGDSNPEFYGISTHSYTSSEVCARCHKDIYDVWKNSMHAKSIDDPVFMADFIMVQLERGKEIKPYCLSCHAPTTIVTKDYDLRRGFSSEGVTCDFCHTIKGLGLPGQPDYYEMDPGAVKYGPFRDADSPAHETEYSEHHNRSEFCAGCHELINDHGVRVMSTYTEWKESAFAGEGVQCQNCHMPIVYDMNVVDPDIKESSHFVTAHEFRGGHSLINLSNAADIETDILRNGRVATVITKITNSESGHKLPTGTPARSVILNTRIRDRGGNILAEINKVYRKVLVDEDGVIIENNAAMILDAAQIFSDNRIAPKETRIETFDFDIPDDVDYFKVENRLQYEFSRPVLKVEKMVYQMAYDIVEVSGGNIQANGMAFGQSPDKIWITVISITAVSFALLSLYIMERRRKKYDDSALSENDHPPTG
jgi:nitrate/TMAO reductase-like tetraheme cytochrome c subunit